MKTTNPNSLSGSSKKNKNKQDDRGKMNRQQLEQACKRLEREVTEYKSKMKEVCDSADQRFKEEKRLRKDWNKAQASMQAKASDAEDLVISLKCQLKNLKS